MTTATLTTTDSAMKEAFSKYAEYLNNLVMFLIIFYFSKIKLIA